MKDIDVKSVCAKAVYILEIIYRINVKNKESIYRVNAKNNEGCTFAHELLCPLKNL